MHELSIALSILEIAEQEAQRRQAAEVMKIHVSLGELSGVVKEALLSAFELAREGSPLSSAELVIDEVPVQVRCDQCRVTLRASPQRLCCSRCGGATPHVVSGRELEVTALEIQ